MNTGSTQRRRDAEKKDKDFRISLRLCASASILVFQVLLSAQTLQQAEALQKQRRYQDANEIFKALVARNPENAEYRVAWGRLFLEHNQPDEAAGLFQEALKLKKDDAGALLGLALIASENYDARAVDLAKQALASDPKLVPAQELLARLALEDNDDAKAAALAKKALEMDPHSVQARAILATMDWLADKKDTQWDPHEARGYETAGHFFTLNRRYEEGIAWYRKAIAMDPELFSARSELGIDLMRLGQNEEAYQQLKLCYDNQFQDKPTRNSLLLMDSYKSFVTFKTDRTILKLNKKEADLLHPYFEAEMEKVIDTYDKKYKFHLDHPVQIEVYPNHEDFAVRTLGMPGLGGILGVTFSSVIAMDSPSGRPPGSFHWASTMWHEMSHVYTLTMTRSHVPRWFTEGIAVHEETAASPEWGDRMAPEVIAAIKGKTLLPVAELDRGFIHPVTPAQVLVSYYQAGRICDYITEKWGWDTILAMLKDFAANDDTATVIRKELKIEPPEFDKQFFALVENENKNVVQHFAEWKDSVKHLMTLEQQKDWDGLIREGSKIRDFYPDYVEEHSVYELLAEAYLAKGDKQNARAQLERYTKTGGRNPETLKLLARQLIDAGDKKEAAAVLERVNYIYPMDNEQHQMLGGLWLDMGNVKGAIREFRAVTAHSPLDPARAHYDLARAYNLDHQGAQAKEELFAALEIAPSYRPAQKLLLELTDSVSK